LSKLLAVCGYSALTLIITYPLAVHIGTRVPHDLGDPILSTIILWWNAHQTPLTTAWWNGPFFWPASSTLALSDHRLGESLLASPLQWAGLGTLTAYNITLLATFPACALAAHWLAHTLTGRHDAATVAGLAYGFSPYRFAHIEHLELLAAFGMPIALVALHRYMRERRPAWLIVLSGALFLQALLCSYYVLFFVVMLGLWIVWFARWRDAPAVAAIGAACAIAAVAVSPIAFHYLGVHKQYGLARGINDIVTLSADVTSVVTAPPLSALWGRTSVLNDPERQLFPGLTVLLLVAVATVAALVSRPHATGRRGMTSLLAISLVFGLVAASAIWLGPWRIGRLSVGTWFKPFSLAFYALAAALLVSPPVRAAYRRQSAFAFYVLAAVLLFVFSWGPKPQFLHQQFLYESPYAWLMQLSVFREGVRVPARFAMPAILALSTAAALAYARLAPRGPRGLILAGLVSLAIVADSWIVPLQMFAPPERWPDAIGRLGATASVELPLGDTMRDIAAMYRGMAAGLPIANGNSGYAPPHYRALTLALASNDDTALEPLAARGPIVAVVDRTAPQSDERLAWLRASPIAVEAGSSGEFTWFVVKPVARPERRCSSETVPIVAARDWWGPMSVAPLVDRANETFWISGDGQQKGDLLEVDFGRVAQPCAVRLGLGARPHWYPNSLSVAASTDALAWTTVLNRKMGGDAVQGALDAPLDVKLDLALGRVSARYLRLRLEADRPEAPWIVTELTVAASRPE
jgi:hypothetical protein